MKLMNCYCHNITGFAGAASGYLIGLAVGGLLWHSPLYALPAVPAVTSAALLINYQLGHKHIYDVTVKEISNAKELSTDTKDIPLGGKPDFKKKVGGSFSCLWVDIKGELENIRTQKGVFSTKTIADLVDGTGLIPCVFPGEVKLVADEEIELEALLVKSKIGNTRNGLLVSSIAYA